MKRAGFTMIELVFVIVILGILAAVAVPRLSQTKDDAVKSAEKANLETCLKAGRLGYFNNSGITAATVKALEGCKELDASAASVAYAAGILTVTNATEATLNTTYPLN